ncbi:hypothetical protein GCM10010274_39300 [Streptomyces lavendofoliae]|uniref:Uncharacterized protein n=1 Tax=Streptomyces lavendofoliae TaxID=67314 RepID=A0A918HZC9_9ACTN|nr:hypothetical protein GCM10010274_39300 [Streptomyces lavendofoliae]
MAASQRREQGRPVRPFPADHRLFRPAPHVGAFPAATGALAVSRAALPVATAALPLTGSTAADQGSPRSPPQPPGPHRPGKPRAAAGGAPYPPLPAHARVRHAPDGPPAGVADVSGRDARGSG